MSAQRTFEMSIDWTLKFKDNELEETYREERRQLKRVPSQISCAWILLALMAFSLVFLDIMGAYVFNTSYSYNVYDIVIMCMYIPIFIAELMFYKCARLTIFRGTVFTICMNFFMFFGTITTYAAKLDYPAISPT